MTNHNVSPSIYVSVLADYNNGYLHGTWIDATQSVDDIWQDIYKLYITSNEPNVTATVCNECDHITLYNHNKCSSCNSTNIKIVPRAEEYAIHDYEGFKSFTVSEYSSIEEIADMAVVLSNVCDDDDLATITFLEGLHEGLDTIKDKIDDVTLYHGSRGDYAEELITDICQIPDLLIHYIDYDKFGRDLEINGEIVEIEHDVYVTNASEF